MQLFKGAAMRSLQLRRIAAVAAAVLALGCGGSTSPEAPACDQVCAITNGASASVATTYWRIDGLSCGQGTCFTKIAFFADGTGELTSGTSNCVLGSTPSVVTFTWTQTGPSTMLLSGSAFSCSPNPATSSGVIIGSFTSITGGVSSGVFNAGFNGTSFVVQAGLLAGTF
jgi:hypothetical protein